MKIGIIGPNKSYSSDLSTEDRKNLLSKVAKIIAGTNNDIVLTPNKDSLLEYFGIRYKHSKGQKIWLVLPTEEQSHEEYLNTDLGEIICCKDWDGQANEFNRQCDVFVCVGYAWGALKEIACAQYFNKKKIFMINELISNKLPKELNFLLDYISIADLQSALEKAVI
jgi:hypothetical protein